MISRRFSSLQKVVALAPLLLLAVYLPGEMMLRCRFDGSLRRVCCCPHESKGRDTGPVVKAQDCCDRELTRSERPAVASVRTSSAVDMAWAVSVAVPAPTGALSFVDPVRANRAWHAQGPPREGPTLVLLKHAFLI